MLLYVEFVSPVAILLSLHHTREYKSGRSYGANHQIADGEGQIFGGLHQCTVNS